MSKEGTVIKVLDAIREEKRSMTRRLEAVGMVKAAIEKFFDGEEIIICYYCNTPNMFKVYYNKDNEWSMHECLKCSKIHMKDWKKA